jgi:hypothetical protein
MKRFMLLVLVCGLSLALGKSAPAQTCAEVPLCLDGATAQGKFPDCFCIPFGCATQLPSCPDDGATPIGEFPACSCPRPSSCGDFPDFSYSCGFDNLAFQWSCSCTDLREPEPPPTHTAPEEHDFCSDFVCPDGTRAFSGALGQGCLCRASLIVPFEKKPDRHCRIAGSASGNLKYSQSSGRSMLERLMRSSQTRLAFASATIGGGQCKVQR